MRDGVRLFTAVYIPNKPVGAWPLLMVRTPYSSSPYGADQYRDSLGPSESFEQAGYIFVFQDVRGRYMSEGEFVNMRPHQEKKGDPRHFDKNIIDESTDTWDTIEWLLKHIPHHNGKVGQWGNSYPGFYTAAGAIDSHPALAAVSPQAPIADWFWDDFHRHGAFILPMAFNFFSSFGQHRPEPTIEKAESIELKTPDGYQFFLDLGPLKNVNKKYFEGKIAFWNDLAAHPNYDQYWQAKGLLPHLKNIGAAVLTVGGWYDTEDLHGPLKIYRAIEKNNPNTWNTLVMGPWRHGGWNSTSGDSLGAIEFGFETSAYFQEHVLLPFFEYFLKGEGEFEQPEAMVFETGANRFRDFSSWPPPGVRPKSLYLRADGKLAFSPPAEQGEIHHDAYVSDPQKPVPYTMEITGKWAKSYMTEDQRFAAWRPDVLVYRGEVLEEDLTLAGPLYADLWVSTTGGDSDFVVKIIDVLPGEIPGYEEDSDKPNQGGYQQLVRAEVFRGRFRESYETPKPFVPGKITNVRYELQDVLHTFKKGHRLMIQIQSTWFPFVDRNPQKWVANIFEAEEDDFISVTNQVMRSKEYPSRVEVGILP
jgi:putative CocE/NonD family hydrolase